MRGRHALNTAGPISCYQLQAEKYPCILLGSLVTAKMVLAMSGQLAAYRVFSRGKLPTYQTLADCEDLPRLREE